MLVKGRASTVTLPEPQITFASLAANWCCVDVRRFSGVCKGIDLSIPEAVSCAVLSQNPRMF